MALRLVFDFHGLVAPEAYARVEQVEWKYGEVATATIVVYATQAEASPISSFIVELPDFDPTAAQTQAYTGSKETDVFLSAVDVIDEVQANPMAALGG